MAQASNARRFNPRMRLLLASSSLAALLVAGGAPAAFAAACTHTITASFDNPGGHTTANVCVSHTSFTGDITNEGTISPSGIAFVNGTLTGNITSTGIIAGGISLDGTSEITTSTGAAISIIGSGFSGGISNSGTISSGKNGIVAGGSAAGTERTFSTFSGGISNSGTISASSDGIFVGGTAENATLTVSSFSGGISNSGTISAGNNGIFLGGLARFDSGLTVSNFSGGISNSGTISAGNYGIFVGGSARSGSGLTVSNFSGGISNSGTISASSDGIFVGGTAANATLTVSAFSGGISNSGTISAGNNGIFVGAVGAGVTIASFAGGIGNSGTISAGHSGSGILVHAISNFSGGISNSGTITSGAFGIAAYSASTFLGGISNAGTIRAAYGIVASSIAQFGSSSAGGGIVNSGTIVAGHTGILIVSGVTFASGSAIVNSGTISGSVAAINVSVATSPVTIDQTGGLIAGDILLSANADVLNISGGTINGDIAGGGGVATQDTINFNLGSGTFTYGNLYGFATINQVNVNSGTVILDGESNANTTTVHGGDLQIGDAADPGALLTSTVAVDGGTLSGHGTIAGAVTVNAGGTLEPGGSIGTLTIANGPLTFAANSVYAIELNDTAASKTVVNGAPGTAIINGGTVEAMPQYTTLGAHGGTSFTIVATTGDRTGTFSAVTSNDPNFTGTFSLSYNTDDVFLDVGKGFQILPLPPGLTINQQDVVTGINNAIVTGVTIPAGFQTLNGLTGPAYQNALTQLDGEAATGAERGAFDLMNEFLGLMLDPFVDGRGGFGFGPQAAPPSPLVTKAPLATKAPPAASFTQRWSVWAAGFGGSGTTNGDPAVGSNNVTTGTSGYAAGMDYHVSPDTVLGFSLAGGGTHWNLANALGTGRSDAFLAGVYGVTHRGPWYLGAALAFANNWFTTNRTALGDQLTANFQGQNYAARLEGGYRLALPASASGAGSGWGLIGITPYAALQAQNFHTPAYSETDLTGGGFGLSYDAMNGTDTRSELGSRFDDLTGINNLPLILRAKLAWAHDWVSNPALNASFESLPGSSFTVNGAPIPHNSALTSAGAQLFFTPNWSLLAKFDGEFAGGYQLYAGSGTLRYTW